jgi:hypothetical protein
MPMKKLRLILASLVLFTGVSFASPRQTTQPPAASTKKTDKRAMANNHKKDTTKAATAAPVKK